MDENDSGALSALMDYIARHQLHAGAVLPPERELAQTLGISRRMLRLALAQLELEGRVWRGVGRGTFLGARPQKFASGFDALFRDTSPADVMQARLIIEPAVAGIAAAKATAAELLEIRRCIRQNAAAHDDDAWHKWDHRFHQLLAQSTRNQALISLVDGMNNARGQPGWRSRRVATVGEQARRDAVAEHRAVLEALEAHDAEAAAQAMRQHLIHVQVMLLM
jgi:DNA-binding FadR family transcriptional regulator